MSIKASFLISLAMVLTCSSGYAQDRPLSVPVAINITSHRPLVAALDQLQKELSKPINLEEAPYRNSRYLGSRSVQTISGPKNFLFPIGGTLQVALKESDTDPYAACQTVLSAYRSANFLGGYGVVRRNNRVDVLPPQTIAADGSETTITPVMEHLLSFSAEERSVAETIQLFADTLSRVAGVKIMLANLPISSQAKMRFGADNQSAGDVLMALFAQLSPAPVYYRLLYDPNEEAYYLSVAGMPHDVGQPQPSGAQPNHALTPSPANSPFFRKAN